MDVSSRNPNAHNGEVNSMPREISGEGKRVFIKTYGCQMNLADSELMGGILLDHGYTAADELEDADVILINTCAVRENAEQRVFGRLSHLLRFKHDNPDLILGVTGCMAEHLRDKITDQAPYVDIVAGPDAYRRLPQMLADAMGEAQDPVIDVKLDKSEVYEGLRPNRQKGVGGWITVQRGCDKFCSFCIVPFTRGRERGVPPAEILRHAREMAERGFKEVTLLGQTVNSYQYEDIDFADLLEQVVEIDGLERIRFTSPYPVDFTPKLIETIARHDKISNYLHMPLQSGSDEMLEQMRRQYDSTEFRELVADIREAIPEIALSTDIIVGFPGETDADFAETMEIMRELRFDFAYMFKYSERSNTHAARHKPDDISEEVKGERLTRLIEQQEQISAEVFQSRVGRTYEVLVEGTSKRDDNDLCGRTDDFKMCVFPRPTDRDVSAGDLVDVEIVDCTSHTLLGEAV
jgi:tRNA-2-methylthio-N6-dimethylallyladenosine synthase